MDESVRLTAVEIAGLTRTYPERRKRTCAKVVGSGDQEQVEHKATTYTLRMTLDVSNISP